jgi:hypothetical protein
VLHAVDGVVVTDLSLPSIAAVLSGPDGTPVTLEFCRPPPPGSPAPAAGGPAPGAERRFVVTLVRGSTRTPLPSPLMSPLIHFGIK